MKDRVNGRVVSRAVVVATGITATWDREVLGVALGDSEDGAFWTSFLQALRARDRTDLRSGPRLARRTGVGAGVKRAQAGEQVELGP